MATTFATSSLASFLVDAVVPSHVASLPSMLLGINALSGTYCPCGSAAAPCTGGPLNATAALQRLRPAIVRTHDAKLLDPHIYKSGHAPWGIPTFNWNDVYPDLKADPMHPQSFDWTIVDAWMSQWDALGIPVLLRLGDSWAPKAAVSNISLVDAEHLSTAFVQVVRHLNDGWGGGRAPPAARLRIRYVEVWNEPEGDFWTGSLPAFYRLLTLTIQKLRAYDDDLRVGPNNASPYGENGGTLRKGFELTALDAVLNATTDARLRPTLYSWHAYIHQNPTLFGTLINETRARLDARGLVDAEQVITEWNPCAEGECKAPDERDAWAAADLAQSVLVHATRGVTVSAPYPLCAVNQDWGLLSTAAGAATGTLTWRPQAYGFQMMSDVLHDTPHAWRVHLPPVVQRGPPTGTGAERAAVADDKHAAAGFASADHARVNIVYVARMADRSARDHAISVRVGGLQPNASYSARAFVINETVNYELLGEPHKLTVGASGSLAWPDTLQAASPSVLRISFSRSEIA